MTFFRSTFTYPILLTPGLSAVAGAGLIRSSLSQTILAAVRASPTVAAIDLMVATLPCRTICTVFGVLTTSSSPSRPIGALRLVEKTAAVS